MELIKNRVPKNLRSELFRRLGRDKAIEVQMSMEANPRAWFCPNGAQERMIKAIFESMEDSPTPVCLFTCANGVGKTTVLKEFADAALEGPQCGWLDHPLLRNWPYPKLMWVCSTAARVKDMAEDFKAMLPSKGVVWSKESKAYYCRAKLENEWEVRFWSYEQNASELEGPDVGIVLLDEPPPETFWSAIKSRRRMGCIVAFFMTPLSCDPYIIDEIYEKAASGAKGYKSIEASVYEASTKDGIRGHLNPEIIEQMVSDYSEDEREARVYGHFMFYREQIFPEFSKSIHVVNPSEYPIPSGEDLVGIIHVADPHDGRPTAMLWAAVCTNGRVIVFAEYPQKERVPFWERRGTETLNDEVRAIFETEAQFRILNPDRVIDKRYGYQMRKQSNGPSTTLARMFAEAGEMVSRSLGIKKDIIFQPSYTVPGVDGEIQYGHNLIHEMLRLLPDGKPGLVFWNTCHNCIDGMTHYIKDNSGTRASEKIAVASTKIVDRFKDFPDIIRYMGGHQIFAPPKRKKGKLKSWSDNPYGSI
jgi:hypothetical protein